MIKRLPLTVILAFSQIAIQGYFIVILSLINARIQSLGDDIASMLITNNFVVSMIIQPALFIALREHRLPVIHRTFRYWFEVIIIFIPLFLLFFKVFDKDASFLLTNVAFLLLMCFDVQSRHLLVITANRWFLIGYTSIFLIFACASYILIYLEIVKTNYFTIIFLLPFFSTAIIVIYYIKRYQNYNELQYPINITLFIEILRLGIMFGIVPLAWFITSVITDKHGYVTSYQVYIVMQVLMIIGFFPQFVLKHFVLNNTGPKNVSTLFRTGLTLNMVMIPLIVIVYSATYFLQIFDLHGVLKLSLVSLIINFSIPFAAEIITEKSTGTGIILNLCWAITLILQTLFLTFSFAEYLNAIVISYLLHLSCFTAVFIKREKHALHHTNIHE